MTNKKSPNSGFPLIKLLLAVCFITALIGGWYVWYLIFKPNVPAELPDKFVHIPTGSDLDDVTRLLFEQGFLIDTVSFQQMALRMKYRGRAGRFEIQPGWSNFKLVRHLRSGKQSPVRVVLVNERLPEDVAGKVSRYLEADSLSLLTLMQDPVYLDSLGYTPATVMSLFIPNTYEFYWNTSARKFMERMKVENDRFWKQNDREEKARKLGLSKVEVYILASIVERETNVREEMPRIAGVYLNRLRIGMLLQADPTLVFASRDWESRDLAKYKTLDSPYNTYKYPGLPPGPISMASIPAIDAVLNAEKHDYLFFCSTGDGSGRHAFARTYDAHLENVRKYRRALIERGLGL